MEEDSIVAFELGCLAFNIEKKVCGVLDYFFLKQKEEKKVYNMLSLMLNLRFKNLCLVSSFIGLKQTKAIIGRI
jgi:hypothetical protein